MTPEADAPAVAAVLGCGVIGSSWIQVFADSRPVRAWDPDPAVRARLRAVASDSVAVFDTPEEAVEGAGFVQESSPEDLATKRALYARITERLHPAAVVASSTSTLQPSALQAGLAFAARVLVGHPFNPPHIIPLVEVIGGAATADWAVEAAMAFYAAVGKHPIRLNLERPGHLANRLQAALWREACDAVASGQASVADVDAAMTLALGPRWALMGPFATFHLGGGEGGLAHFLAHLGLPFEALWDDLKRPTMTESLKDGLVEAVSRSLGGRPIAALAADRNDRLRQVLEIGRAPLGGPAVD